MHKLNYLANMFRLAEKSRNKQYALTNWIDQLVKKVKLAKTVRLKKPIRFNWLKGQFT